MQGVGFKSPQLHHTTHRQGSRSGHDPLVVCHAGDFPTRSAQSRCGRTSEPAATLVGNSSLPEICQKRCLAMPHTALGRLRPPQPLSCDVVLQRGVSHRYVWCPRSLHTAEVTALSAALILQRPPASRARRPLLGFLDGRLESLVALGECRLDRGVQDLFHERLGEVGGAQPVRGLDGLAVDACG
jgi:hypothetical protein